MPTAAGDGFDRTTRMLQPHLEDALGVPLEVVYRPVADESRVLAVQQDENLWPGITDGAPTVRDALGVEVRPNEFRYQLWVTRGCREDHPRRYGTLAAALEEAVGREAYRAALEEAGELGSL